MYKHFVLILSLLLQVIAGQFCNDKLLNWPGYVNPSQPWSGVQQPYANLPYYPQDRYGMDIASLSASTNCGFPVSSSSPIEPGVLSITSENVIEGPVSVYGQLPFLSTVTFEGSIPTFGYGGVAYGSGYGNVGILSESVGDEWAYEVDIPAIRPDSVIPYGRPGPAIPSGIPGAGLLPGSSGLGLLPGGSLGVGIPYGTPSCGVGLGFNGAYY